MALETIGPPRPAASFASSPLLVASAATILFLCWQWLLVSSLYGGNWTALFCTGDKFGVPPELAQGTFVWKGSEGYDGQFYRYVAHDPLARRDLYRYIDAPEYRYRRILIPALAFLLGAGDARFIDAAYYGVIAGFVFLGAWWVSRYAVLHGKQPLWGLGFLLVPSTLVAMDRMTVDVALAALVVAFVVYAESGARMSVQLLVLAAGCLVREIGFFLPLAATVHALSRRNLGRAARFAFTPLPALAWFAFLYIRMRSLDVSPSVTGVPRWFFRHLTVGPLLQMFGAQDYPLRGYVLRIVQSMDAVGLCGAALSIVLAVWWLKTKPYSESQIAALLFLTIAVTSNRIFWSDPLGYSRPISPLLLLLGLRTLTGESLWNLAPALLVDARLGLLFLWQLTQFTEAGRVAFPRPG